MINNKTTVIELEPINKLSKDLLKASHTLSDDEARFLVDAYYQMQDNRIRADGQIRSIEKGETPEPHAVLDWLSTQNSALENQIKNALHKYALSKPIGEWMLSICGIGPVISAGLMAHIDINKAIGAGNIWRYAGLDPTVEWKKGEKRPFNATLKTLCWKIGESFIKVSSNEKDFYGQIYKERKAMEQAKNERGDFKEQAEAKLAKYKIGKTTDAYKSYIEGRLPPAHIHARARRYAVKMFLSHLFEVWRQIEGLTVTKPFALTLNGHTHYIAPPNF